MTAITTLPTFNVEEITHKDKKYTPDFNRVKFSQVLAYQTKLKSGMTLVRNEATGDATIVLSEEYVQREGQVIVQLIKAVFAIDFDLDELPTMDACEIYEFIEKSPFFMKLQAQKK